MSSDILHNLPSELCCEVGRALPCNDLRHLSEASTRFHQLLVPILFSTIRVTNRPSDQDAIAHAIAKHGQHIRAVSITVDLGSVGDPPLHGEGEDENGTHWASFGLPSATRDLLAGKTLPAVTSIAIRFAWDSEDPSLAWYDDWRFVLAADRDLGEYDPVQVQEKIEKWCSSLDTLWQALAGNSQVRRLAVKELLPVVATAWSHPAWATFLGRLETLELGLWGGERRVEAIWNFGRYQAFHSDLHLHFYRHLSGKSSLLRRFCLESDHAHPIGADNNICAPPYRLSTPKGYMPNLQELCLDHCLLSWDLATFIAERGRSNLRTVELIDCFSSMGPVTKGAEVTWKDFFEKILTTGDRRGIVLEQFVLLRTYDFRMVKMNGNEFDQAEFERAHELPRTWSIDSRVSSLLKQHQRDNHGSQAFDADEMVFAYINLWEDGGWGWAEPTSLPEADLAACKELMDIVRAKRAHRVNH